MSKVKYCYGGIGFRTKADIKKYAQQILHEEIPMNKQFMLDIMENHPTKIFDNPVITIGINDYGINQFLADGEPFSYLKCISPPSKSAHIKANVTRALRNAIKQQIFDFRDSKCINGSYMCEISNELLPRCDIEIDHHYELMPFKTIVSNYLNEYKISLSDIKIESLPNGGWCLCEPEQFQLYHKKHAILRVLKKSINQSHR